MICLDTPEYIEVKLNDSYTAKIYKNKIKVGCQEFPIEIVEKLKKALGELK
jgi:hypothetical protein